MCRSRRVWFKRIRNDIFAAWFFTFVVFVTGIAITAEADRHEVELATVAASERKVDGIVISEREVRSRGLLPKWSATIEFVADDGRTYTTHSKTTYNEHEYRVGDTVNITYADDDPEVAFETSRSVPTPRERRLGGVACLIASGLGAIGSAIYTLRSRGPRK